jgi:hypothetical protein
MNLDLEPNGVEPQRRTNPGSASQEDDHPMQPIDSVQTSDAVSDHQEEEAFHTPVSPLSLDSRFRPDTLQSSFMKDRAHLPVELMIIISEFLLGDSLFGTLANLNATCHAIHEETSPVLNETLVLDTVSSWRDEDHLSSDTKITGVTLNQVR